MEITISRDEYRILKLLYKIGSREMDREDVDDTDMQRYHELAALSYIDMRKEYVDECITAFLGEEPERKRFTVSITENGKAYVESYKLTNRRFWIPTIISLIALSLSIPAILLTLRQLSERV